MARKDTAVSLSCKAKYDKAITIPFCTRVWIYILIYVTEMFGGVFVCAPCGNKYKPSKLQKLYKMG